MPRLLFFFTFFLAFSLSSVWAYTYTSFAGSNLYYAAGLSSDQQHTLLSALKTAGAKVLRVWLDGIL